VLSVVKYSLAIKIAVIAVPASKMLHGPYEMLSVIICYGS
jgi:hypothetical protein